jgi:flagellar basal-body rod modification protein FlgD
MATTVINDTASNPYAKYVNANAASASTGIGATSGAPDSGQDRFLTLLVTQMKNQDPLNPLDNAQVTSQLAQINTVNGIEKLNATMTKLMGSNQSMQGMQAASLVGHDVLAEGNALTLADGAAQGGFTLPEGADLVTVTVKSASGQAIHQAQLKNLGAGLHTFTWDGKTDSGAAAANGKYSFGITASTNGKSVSATPLSVSRVDGVTPGDSGVTVRTSTGETLDWAKIQQVM